MIMLHNYRGAVHIMFMCIVSPGAPIRLEKLVHEKGELE